MQTITRDLETTDGYGGGGRYNKFTFSVDQNGFIRIQDDTYQFIEIRLSDLNAILRELQKKDDWGT